MYRNISKSIRNDTFPSVSKVSYGQSDKNKIGKRYGKAEWTSK